MPVRRKLTVRLPEENVDFVKRYAAEHGTTVTDVLDRYLSRLRESDVVGQPEARIDPKVEQISGLVPSDADARGLYHEHLLEKHR